MSLAEGQPGKNREEKLVECTTCGLTFDPTTSFKKVKIPTGENQSSTEYLAGTCPSCGAQDKILFEWSGREIQKQKKEKEPTSSQSNEELNLLAGDRYFDDWLIR